MEVFSTARIHRKDKVDYWRNLCSETYSGIDIEPIDGGSFEGTLCRHPAGPSLSISKVSSSPGRIVRSEKHMSRHSGGKFQIFLYDQGGGHCRQAGREATVSTGDFILIDISQPYRFEFQEFCSAISVGIPETFVELYLPRPQQAVGTAMSGRQGVGRVAASLIKSLYDEIYQGSPREVSPGLSRGLVEVLASAYTENPNVCVSETAVSGSRRVRIRRFIEAHLADPRLAPGTVAEAVGISPRYLRLLFAEEKETVARYILRRRLEECARRMTDPRWDGVTITEIALRWGFNDTTHFGRAFREYYGVSPRAYRQSHGSAPEE